MPKDSQVKIERMAGFFKAIYEKPIACEGYRGDARICSNGQNACRVPGGILALFNVEFAHDGSREQVPILILDSELARPFYDGHDTLVTDLEMLNFWPEVEAGDETLHRQKLRLTVKELKSILDQCDENALVVTSSDIEGNSFHYIDSIETGCEEIAILWASCEADDMIDAVEGTYEKRVIGMLLDPNSAEATKE